MAALHLLAKTDVAAKMRAEAGLRPVAPPAYGEVSPQATNHLPDMNFDHG